MGSLEKIDNNNFVIKIKRSCVPLEYSKESFDHLGYSWRLKCTRDASHAFYHLSCSGPPNKDDDLWNIDVNLVFDLFKNDGTKLTSIAVSTCFTVDHLATYGQISNIIEQDAVDIEVYVRINCIGGIPRNPVKGFKNEDDELSDVTLIVEGKNLYANKAILATFSPVFRAMFFSGFKETTDKEVVINDAKYDHFEDFLQVIYSSSAVINENNIGIILILADRFDVGIVMEKCEKYLIESDMYLASRLRFAEIYTLSTAHKYLLALVNTKAKVLDMFGGRHLLGPMTLRALMRKLTSFE